MFGSCPPPRALLSYGVAAVSRLSRRRRSIIGRAAHCLNQGLKVPLQRAPAGPSGRRRSSPSRRARRPTISITSQTTLSKTIAQKIAPMIGNTAMRPYQLISRSWPWRSGVLGQQQRHDLARGQHRQRPARQQLEVPADGGAREDREPVDDRVEQRAHAAVLAGGARHEAVHVVAGGDQPEQPPGPRVVPVARSRRPGRGRPGSPRAAGSRSRSGSSTGAAAGPSASRAAAAPSGPGRSGGGSCDVAIRCARMGRPWHRERKQGSAPRARRTSRSGSRASSATPRSPSSTTSAAAW